MPKTLTMLCVLFLFNTCIKADSLSDAITAYDNSALWRHFQGKVLLVHFWATWCTPCREELPLLSTLATKPGMQALNIVTVAADSHENVRRFRSTNQLDLPVLVDQYGQALYQYNIDVLPTSILLNKDGGVLWRVSGKIDWTEEQIANRIQNYVLKSQ